MAIYKFRGYTIRNCGYHQPDHHIVWEATDPDGAVVAHGKTLRECELVIAEQDAVEQFKAIESRKPKRNLELYDNQNDAWFAFKKQNGRAYFDLPSYIAFVDWLFDKAKGETDGNK